MRVNLLELLDQDGENPHAMVRRMKYNRGFCYLWKVCQEELSRITKVGQFQQTTRPSSNNPGKNTFEWNYSSYVWVYGKPHRRWYGGTNATANSMKFWADLTNKEELAQKDLDVYPRLLNFKDTNTLKWSWRRLIPVDSLGSVVEEKKKNTYTVLQQEKMREKIRWGIGPDRHSRKLPLLIPERKYHDLVSTEDMRTGAKWRRYIQTDKIV